MQSTIFGAAVENDSERIKELLSEDPFIDCGDRNGCTALHLAGESLRCLTSIVSRNDCKSLIFVVMQCAPASFPACYHGV